MDEHIAACTRAIKQVLGTVKTSGNNDSSLPEHSLLSGHTFRFEDFSIIHTEKKEIKRKVLEEIEILLNTNAVNSSEGKHFKFYDLLTSIFGNFISNGFRLCELAFFSEFMCDCMFTSNTF